MFSWLKKFAMSAAIAGALGLAPVVRADTVSYHVVAFFTQAGTNSQLTGATVVGLAGSGKTGLIGTNTDPFHNYLGDFVSLFNETYVGNSGPFAAVDIADTDYRDPLNQKATTFGKLTFGGSTKVIFAGARLELDIYQDATDPASGGTDTGSGKFVGAAQASFIASGNDAVTLKFDSPLSFVLPTGSAVFPPAVQYLITQTQPLNEALGNQEIRGTVSEVVPLPKTVSVGLTMFGALGVVAGGVTLRRRNAAAV